MRRLLLAAALVAAAGGVVPSAAADARPAQGRPAWHLTLTAARPTVTIGHRIWLHGRVSSPDAVGMYLRLEEQTAPGGRWVVQRQARIRADRTFTTYDAPTKNIGRSYRVVLRSTRHHSQGRSAPVPVQVYGWTQLTSLTPANADHLGEVTSVPINAVDYASSLVATMVDGTPTDASIEYNLDHLCLRMRATYGLSDASEDGAQASVTVLADGQQYVDATFGLGQSQTVASTFAAAPLKLRVQTASLVPGLDGLGAVGTPEVLCTR